MCSVLPLLRVYYGFLVLIHINFSVSCALFLDESPVDRVLGAFTGCLKVQHVFRVFSVRKIREVVLALFSNFLKQNAWEMLI